MKKFLLALPLVAALATVAVVASGLTAAPAPAPTTGTDVPAVAAAEDAKNLNLYADPVPPTRRR